MLISFGVLQRSLERYQTIKKEKENYNAWDSASTGASAGLSAGFLLVAIIFVLLELTVMIFGLNVAIKCTKPGGERVVHVVLAIAFTFPYVLYMLLFNQCASNVIKGETSGSTVFPPASISAGFANKF